MIVGIDASNIKSEGGIIHLNEIINNINFKKFKNVKIIIWGNNNNLKQIKNYKNIKKENIENFSKNLFSRFLWQIFFLPKLLIKNKCSILFVLGGIFFNKKIKTVTIFQNILPFITSEIRKYNFFERYKMYVQKKIYINSFKNSDGMIFLSAFSKRVLSKELNLLNIKNKIIPHGISDNFKFKKRIIKNKKKINFLYVSKIDVYKNHHIIISALGKLKKELNFCLNLVGSYNLKYKIKLEKLISELNLKKNIKFHGIVKNSNLNKMYNTNDIKIHFSNTETFGMTMAEAMKCGLPILSLRNEISKEVIGNAGFFCDNNETNIKKTIYEIIRNNKNFQKKILEGKKRSNNFKWKNSSNETFLFLKKITKL